MTVFASARREQMRLRMALQGPPNSGKTYTSFVLARALSPDGRFAVIDTEQRALEYADRFDFGHVAPSTADPTELPRHLAAAAQEGFGAVVVDSFSLYWSGQGGALDRVDRASDKRTGWNQYRSVENAMMRSLLNYPGHVLVTMRVKTDQVTEVNDKGKTVTRKVGLKFDQRDSAEYDFSVMGEMDTAHTLAITKTTCQDLTDRTFERPGLDLVDILTGWLGQGEPVPSVLDYRDRAVDKNTTYDELRTMWSEVKRRSMLEVLVVDDNGETVPLGSLIDRLARERKPVQLAEAMQDAAA